MRRWFFALYMGGCGLGLVAMGCAGGPPGARPHASASGRLQATVAARARIAEVRARFRAGPTNQNPVIGPGIASGFDWAGADHVQPVLAEDAKRAVLKSATVELPASADGAVRVEDDASHVAVAFALRGASTASISVANGVALYARALAGADVLQRPRAEGTEDFVAFDHAPVREELYYDVDVSRVAGLRLVANTLEFLDRDGAPRLRVAPPVVFDAEGARHVAALGVEGCAFDASPRAPWNRAVTTPGATRCGVRVTWSGVPYPALVDPAWVSTGSMATARENHTLTMLATGKVLVAGGINSSYVGTAELYDPASGTFAATGSLQAARMQHTACLLGSGKVLIAGGRESGGATSESELYDPGSGTFANTGQMSVGRRSHTASVLGSGKVLVAGGNSGISALASAELYDPASGTFSATGSMTAAHNYGTATQLASGKVLVAGAAITADVYSPATGTFAATGAAGDLRYDATASVLASGKVLLAGGTDALGGNSLVTAELYDPATNAFAATGSMASARSGHVAGVLASGTVVIAGGSSSSTLSSAELYDPVAGAFSPTGSMKTARENDEALVLASGKLLVTGGIDNVTPLASAELFAFVASGGSCTIAGECQSGVCNGGSCCSAACSGSCKTCAAGTGACAAVTSADDPDTCTGAYTCDASGACKKKSGQICGAASECASGFCADGYCCSTACAGACDVCDATPGTCKPAAAGESRNAVVLAHGV